MKSKSRSFFDTVVYVTVFAVLVAGCRSVGKLDTALVQEAPAQREISVPNIDSAPSPVAVNVSEPLTVNQQQEPESWPLSLEDVVRMTMENSDVVRNIGGRVINGAAPTVYDVALQELGVEQALAAFDAQVSSTLNYGRDERAFNNLFIGGGATSLASNTSNFNLQLSKQSASGSQFFLRNVTGYNRNNVPGNLFTSSYDTALEGEFRQPLLRGRGLAFNRIAGPNGGIGVYNGVLIARIRTDIALADFESNVRQLILDVETAYWNLYFAYRSLDARTAAYEAALSSWQTVQDQLEAGTADGEQEALARANFYIAKVALQNALSGGGSGTGIVGVYSAERNLRRLMGIPANDGMLIRPADEPSSAKRIFGWQESIDMALERRVELRRQRWTVKQRQSELLAARNGLLAQIDLTGLYRWRGFGDDLIGNRDTLNGSAFTDLWNGDLQGWQFGLQYSTTLGKRREHAAVRAAEIQLARDRAILRNQEMNVSNTLSGQFAEMERAYEVARASFNRSIAERTRLDAATAKYEAGEVLLNFVLQAQQTTADADSQYHQSLVNYNLAIANMHVQRGTYLDYMGVRLSEGPWSPDAYCSYRKEFRRFKPSALNYCMMEPHPAASAGAYSQRAPQGQAMSAAPMMDGQIMQGEVIYEGQVPTGMPIEPPMGEMIPFETIPVEGPTMHSPLLPFEAPSAMAPPTSVPVTPVSAGANDGLPNTNGSLNHPLSDWKP